MRERKKNTQYVSDDIENEVNKINYDEGTTGRDQDMRTYQEIKSTAGDR